MMKIYIQTLGCKVNQYESQAMESILREHGHDISDTPEGCGAYIINTCAVTAESGRKSRQAVRHLQSINPEAVIAVCGCFSQISPDDAESLGADIVFGSADRLEFIDSLEKCFLTREKTFNIDEALKRRKYENLPAGNLGGRTRAMLKIQDGCSNFCSYCIIPYARGPVRSMAPEIAVKEAARLSSEGYRELIVTGIEIASYGRDLGGVSLSDTVCDIASAANGARIRLGSLEPRVVTEEFCKKLASAGNVCDHFHLSLQSGCDETLKRMNRKYDTARFLESVTLLRRYFPDCGLTADLIVGFPGETEEEFSKTLEFIKKCGFSSMHIFPYSIRPGTVAAKMENQLSKGIKKERAHRAAEAADKLETAFLNSCVGKTLEVLFEQEENGFSFGHAGNYCTVFVQGVGLHNRSEKVFITGTKDGMLSGSLIS